MIAAYSFYFGSYSWASHARGFFDALNSLEEVALIPWDDPPSALQLSQAQQQMLDRGKGYNSNGRAIAVGPIERMPWARGVWRAGFVVWETTILPADKIRQLRVMDAVWTPSRWGARVLAENGIDPLRIGVVPEGVDPTVFRPRTGHPSGTRFRFLAVGKWEERKAIHLLVSAFCDAFAPTDPVELVLHCFNPYVPRFDLHRSIEHTATRPHAPIVASEHLSVEEMVALYNSCDVFVLPTRAEGWGLPIMEAMACGLPAIVTDYSAPSEYLTDDIAWRVPVEKMVDVYDPVFFPDGGALGKWAQPDFGRLRELMRYAYEHPAETLEKGRRARERVVQCWTWQHAAATARRLLTATSMVNAQ